jgi:hypothetical protein
MWSYKNTKKIYNKYKKIYFYVLRMTKFLKNTKKNHFFKYRYIKKHMCFSFFTKYILACILNLITSVLDP